MIDRNDCARFRARAKRAMAAAGLLLAVAAPSQAIRYEIVPEEKTVLCDDMEAIVLGEYVRRARESVANDKPRTAAAELRRVAALADRMADAASGDAADALKAIKTQALKLAYSAETKSDSAARRTREFATRTENFLEGEWALLEAKHALSRGDGKTAEVFLTVARQQMDRRAQRTAKQRARPFERVATDLGYLLDDLGFLDTASVEQRIADLVKTARKIEPASPKKKEEPTYTYPTYPSYETESYREKPYGTDRYGEPSYRDYTTTDSRTTQPSYYDSTSTDSTQGRSYWEDPYQ